MVSQITDEGSVFFKRLIYRVKIKEVKSNKILWTANLYREDLQKSENDNIEIAELYTVTYDKETGDVFLKMKVIDPVWRQRLLRDWQDLNVKLIVEEK